VTDDGAAIRDRTRQTQVFGTIDSVVQALAILTQIFLPGISPESWELGFFLLPPDPAGCWFPLARHGAGICSSG
jgi:hypothetical protein